MWNYNIENFLAGAVRDIASSYYNKSLGFDANYNYFNAGVLLLNLKKLRNINFLDRCVECVENDKYVIVAQDQDVLNIVFFNQCLMLPIIWNICTPLYHNETKYYQNLDYCTRKEIYENPGIVHFTNIYKPWILFTQHPFKDTYWKYFALTPFKFEYFIHIVKNFLAFIFHYEKYVNRKIFIINFFSMIEYKKLKNKYKKYKYLSIRKK